MRYVQPHEFVIQESNGVINFIAQSQGTTNSKVAFNYSIGDNQDPITKSFTLDIVP